MLISIEWLQKLNQEFREAVMEQRKRPWEAIRRYSQENNRPVNISSNLAKEIFEWFESNSKPTAHQIGSLYDSVYFFDAAFWLVSIPIGYGRVKLSAVDSLIEMPQSLKEEIASTPKSAWDYLLYWADCVDYGNGIDDLRKSNHLDQFGTQLLMAGDQELRTAVSQLKEGRPDSRAILSSRMATEIFLKSFIALKVGLCEKEAQGIGHNLERGFDKFLQVSGYTHWAPLKTKLSVFPAIQDRYNEQDLSAEKLWQGFIFAQSIGTVIIREHTARNTAKQVMDANK